MLDSTVNRLTIVHILFVFVVLCIVLVCVYLCKCVLYFCNRVATQLQLTNIQGYSK